MSSRALRRWRFAGQASRGLCASLLVLAACSDVAPTDLSMEFKETPFRHLRGVDLGMKGKQLQALRPAATFSPYLGMQERIPGFVVSYQFPIVSAGATDPVANQNDDLEGVFITEGFVSKEAAEASWREKVRDVAAAHRKPNSCEKFPAGGMEARWTAGKNVLAIGVFPREPAAPTVGDRVIYAIATSQTMKHPKGGQPTPCPNS